MDLQNLTPARPAPLIHVRDTTGGPGWLIGRPKLTHPIHHLSREVPYPS